MKTASCFQPILAALILWAVLSAHSLYAAASYSLSLSAASSQYVYVPANAGLTPTPVTFEAWVDPSEAKCNTILSRGDGSSAILSDYIFQVGYDGTTCGVMKVGFFGATNWDSSLSLIPLNTWTHVAVTFDGANKQFYINGLLDRTAPRAGSLNVSATSPMYIGRQGTNCDCNFFNGALAEVRIWNVVRTSNEIRSDMNMSVPADQPGLVAYYHLNEGTGAVANDASGNGNTGTLMDGASWTGVAPPMLGTTNLLAGPAAGTNSVVLEDFGAAWTATTNASWLHLSAGNQSGTGSANVVFSFDANSGATRTGALTRADCGNNYIRCRNLSNSNH